MKTFRVVSGLRGFFKETLTHLSNQNICVFDADLEKTYEKPSQIKILLSKIIKWKIFDFLGIFKVIKDFNTNGVDGVISYNRFVKTNIPYFIVMENPYGLMNYSDQRFYLRPDGRPSPL